MIAAFVVGFYKYLDAREIAREGGSAIRWPQASQRPLPPPPRLQTYPFTTSRRCGDEERSCSSTTRGSTRTRASCGFPVERAIEVLAERGLPYRAGARRPAPAAAPSSADAARPRSPKDTGCAALTPVPRVRSSERAVLIAIALASWRRLSSRRRISVRRRPSASVTAVPPAGAMPELLQDVGLDQKLNTQVPLDLAFKDEQGRDGDGSATTSASGR